MDKKKGSIRLMAGTKQKHSTRWRLKTHMRQLIVSSLVETVIAAIDSSKYHLSVH